MITSNDAGEYTCHDCGNKWRARDRYVWWPIGFKWLSMSERRLRGPEVFSSWGWQVGWDGIEQRVFGHTVRIGRLLIQFGPVSR